MFLAELKSPRSPLAQLVLFMVCLAIAGSLLAGTHYVLVDKPAQEYAAHPPENSDRSCITTMGLISYTIVRMFGGYQHTSADCTLPYSVWSCCVY